MRLVKQNILQRDGSGSATLLPEDSTDMWHLYNLIRPNDLLRSSAVRRISTESATGSTTSRRVTLTLVIRVRSTDFDPQASQLHVSGQVAEENQHVKLGGYHTLDLELHRSLTLEKGEGWDSVALGILQDALDQTKKAELFAVAMQEGLANICLITEHQTVLKGTVEMQMPSKRSNARGQYNKAQDKFFRITLDTLLRRIDLSNPKPLLLASPGYTASAFQAFIKQTATETSNKPLRDFLPHILTTHSASGHVYALNEVLASPAVKARLKDTKYMRETLLMDKLAELLRRNDGRAWYGHKEVIRAVDEHAVGRGGGVLLISNALFRSQDIETRRKWVGLVDRVRDVEGGEVRVLSSEHESGKRLESLSNVAAILTFPLLDLDEDEETDEEEGGRQRENGIHGHA
ncbi:MAG: Translation factor pelota [Bathelium mastoideum]|nr:MAG: Translation factor pelota [Bathelium mastoideum]KAI9692573.1 MAG: Translation factor pelota [Bathelium mastoideum]